MDRRGLLTTVGAGSLSLTGCLGLSGLPVGENLPEDCPKSQNLGVAWPRDINASAAATFVEEYEEKYYLEVIFEFDPESRYSRLGSAITRAEIVSESGDCWQVRFAGILGIEEAFTRLKAVTAEPADDARVIPIGAVDDKQLIELLHEAAETGEAERRLSTDDTDEYLDRLEKLAEEFEISPPEYSDTLHFEVNGTIVELTASVDTLHVDQEWDAWYAVDKHEVWRSDEKDIDPRDGDLLECRAAD